MRIRLKCGVAIAAAVAGVTALGTSPAAAYSQPIQSWTRYCENGHSTYTGGFSTTLAYTDKDGNGCAGHAWLKIKKNGEWGEWKHASGGYTVTGSGFQAARHKGCSNCVVYQTFLDDKYI